MELVLEIGPANGDLEYAFDVCAAAKESGADWVKGQIYDRDLLTTKTARTYAHDGVHTAETQYEDFEKQLSYDEWEKVKFLCDDIGIGFFASVFDLGAVDFCESIGVERYKIASGDITYQQLIEKVTATGKPVIMSTGASTEEECMRAWLWATQALPVQKGDGYELKSPAPMFLACSLSYPCKPEDANLLRMDTLKGFTGMDVGYSDHTFGVGALHRAHHLGAVLIEKHFTITPGAGGDHDFAVTPQQLRGMGAGAQGSSIYDGSPVLEASAAERKARTGARRSMYSKGTLFKGRTLEEDSIDYLRPGGGMEPWQADDIIGRPLNQNVARHMAFNAGMFD